MSSPDKSPNTEAIEFYQSRADGWNAVAEENLESIEHKLAQGSPPNSIPIIVGQIQYRSSIHTSRVNADRARQIVWSGVNL